MMFIISLSLSYGEKISAAELTCLSGGNPAPVNVEIAPVNITVSSHITDYSELYRLNMQIVDNVTARCTSSPSGGLVSRAATLTYVSGSGDTSQAGYIIYPTNVSGIGISVNSLDVSGFPAIPAWPAMLTISSETANGTNYWRHQGVTIRLWKIPGDIPSTVSPFGIIGPTVVQGFIPGSGGEHLNPATLTSNRALSESFWIISARALLGSAKLYVGTCNLRTPNQTVQLGKHLNFYRFSEWRDASFIVDCPVKAYGYGGIVNGSISNKTANNKNKAPSLKIIPYSSVIVNDHLGNPLGGTIALDAGGAQGYGVQLAWGDYSTQVTGINPVKPVAFNIPISVSSLVSGYAPTITLGANAPSATVKMAARFIQTEAIPQPGRARAAIEVIANYE